MSARNLVDFSRFRFYDSDELIYAKQLKKDLRVALPPSPSLPSPSTKRRECCVRPTRKSLEILLVELITCARRSIYTDPNPPPSISMLFIRKSIELLLSNCRHHDRATIANFTVVIGIQCGRGCDGNYFFYSDGNDFRTNGICYIVVLPDLGKQLNFDLVRITFDSL